MNDISSTPALREPAQKRSRERMQRVMAAAELLLVTDNPETITIPRLSLAADVPRTAIYPFFPTSQALFAHLTGLHLTGIMERITAVGERLRNAEVATLVTAFIDEVSDYYKDHPAAARLILGGPYSHAEYLARERCNEQIAIFFRELLARRDTPIHLPDSPNIAMHVVEIAFAIIKASYFHTHYISAETRREATVMVLDYLSLWQARAARAGSEAN